MADNKRPRSSIGICSYPHLFKPVPKYSRDPNSDLCYQLNVMFNPNDPWLMVARQEAHQAALEKWPNGVFPPKFRDPFKDGNLMGPEARGKIVITFRAGVDYPPVVFGPNKELVTAQSGKLYPGCLVRVTYNCYAYAEGDGGVNFGLGDVQVVGDGERIAGSSRSDDDFDVVDPAAINNPFNPAAPQPQFGQPPMPYGQPPMQPPMQPQYQPVPGVQQPQFQQPAPGYQQPMYQQPMPGVQPGYPQQQYSQQPMPGVQPGYPQQQYSQQPMPNQQAYGQPPR
jgi:hypothetical protein